MSGQSNVEVQIDFTGALLVRWAGRANDRRPGTTLAPIFHNLIVTGRYLRFDFTQLEHISSSTMVVILKFFKQLNALGVGYDVRYDDRVSWQRMTFAPVEALAMPPAMQIAA